MNKAFFLIAIPVACLFSSCVTQPGPSVSSLGAGSDSAYLNGTRGRSDAQISRAQAEQYSRQRQQVSEEQDLEQKKRQNTIQNTNGMIQGLSGAISIFR